MVITDSLYATKRIFNSSVHPYQIHSAVISQELKKFFSKDTRNHIKFWDCSSKQQWPLHYSVDKETKNMVFIPLFPCKSSWDFYRKSKCNLILSQWRMLFQVADSKERFFLDLLNDNLNPICYGTLNTNNFYFYFLLFFLILLFFFFILFPWRDDEEGT